MGLDPDNGDTFEMRWTDFDQNYAGFEARDVDWDVVYQEYFEQADASTSEDELWRVLTESLNVLYDAHVYLEHSDGSGFESGTLSADPNIEFEFDDDVTETYLQGDIQTFSLENDFALYGTTANENIGYVSIRSFTNDESEWEDDIDQAIGAL